MKVGDEYKYLGGADLKIEGLKKNNIYSIDRIELIGSGFTGEPIWCVHLRNITNISFLLTDLQRYFVEVKQVLDRRKIRKEI